MDKTAAYELQSLELRDLKEDVEVLRGAVRILTVLAEGLAQECGADLSKTMIHVDSGGKQHKPVSAARFIGEFRAALAKTAST